MNPPPVNVICMKWGTLYGPEYVRALHRGVSRHLRRAHRFVCFTDDATGLGPEIECRPLPVLNLPSGQRDTRWRKLAVFGPRLDDLSGSTLFLDLDLVVVDALDPFFEMPTAVSGAVPLIRDDDLFRHKPLRRLRPERDRFLASVGNSSVFRFEIGAHADLLDEYLDDPVGATQRYERSQEFQSAALARRGQLAYWPKGWCVSFKNDCVPRHIRSYFGDPTVPAGARIVVFAGNLKMTEVLAGGGHRLHRHIGRVDWLHQAWQGS
ncbi:MAG TPA: glycosyltransferase [Ideonella sp.]|nr:glycosyltransferase [Ideonella sp.]